jgi:Uma2 family endonuclease
MSALAMGRQSEQSWDDLVRFWEEMDHPEGSKVEIIEGIVTVSPSPANNHNFIAGKIQRRLYGSIPEDWDLYQTQALAVPSRMGLYIPDLAVLPDAAVQGQGNVVAAAEAELVVEITSQRNARHDRISKAAGYAAAGIPLYLLVDRWAPDGSTITLYGEPEDDVYRTLYAGKFGEPVPLPDPFGLTLDTADFPTA